MLSGFGNGNAFTWALFTLQHIRADPMLDVHNNQLSDGGHLTKAYYHSRVRLAVWPGPHILPEGLQIL